MEYNFDITTFSNGLNTYQLYQEIEGENNINKGCIGISRVGSNICVKMDQTLTSSEQSYLIQVVNNHVKVDEAVDKNVYVEGIKYKNYVSNIAKYTITNKSLSSNTDVLLDNWTTVMSSPNIDFDPVTGIFTPSNGYYSVTYHSCITTNTGGLTEIGARLVNNLNETVYASVTATSDLFANETGKEGHQYENLGQLFIAGNTYKIHAKIDSNETMDFDITISKLF